MDGWRGYVSCHINLSHSIYCYCHSIPTLPTPAVTHTVQLYLANSTLLSHFIHSLQFSLSHSTIRLSHTLNLPTSFTHMHLSHTPFPLRPLYRSHSSTPTLHHHQPTFSPRHSTLLHLSPKGLPVSHIHTGSFPAASTGSPPLSSLRVVFSIRLDTVCLHSDFYALARAFRFGYLWREFCPGVLSQSVLEALRVTMPCLLCVSKIGRREGGRVGGK